MNSATQVALFALTLPCLVCGQDPVVFANQKSAEHVERGLLHERAQAFDDAMREYQAAVSADSSSTEAMFNVARMYSLKHQWQEATECYKRVIALDPSDGEAHYQLAMAYTAQMDLLKAVACYDQAKTLGYAADPAGLEPVLSPYRNREMVVEFDSMSGQRMSIRILGNPLGNDELRRDILRSIEILEHGFDPAMLRGVRVAFISWNGDEAWLEHWVVQTASTERAYAVSLTKAAGGGTDFIVTEVPPAEPIPFVDEAHTKPAL